ncbi:hypothetical protein EDC96DRAFT_489511 [Choanephora cucurbitarum]|nr:hypothetical protein EDC96DRAFT_489511 [Choanephora cucurbitarum]
MNSKADLKAAREAIGKKEFNEAVKACKRVLLWEGENYNAWVFLGVAYTGLEDDQEAEEAYKRAIEINNDNMLGWHGLVSFYEKREKLEPLAKTIHQLIPRVIASQDGVKLADYLKKLLQVYQKQGNDDLYLETLKEFLPISPHFNLIKDQPDLPSPIDIWKRIIQKMEKEQSQQIEKEAASRRFRVNAGTPAQVLAGVEADIYGVSKLHTMYENVLALIPDQDKEEQQEWKLKLLHFYTKRLLGTQEKAEMNEKIMTLANELMTMNDPLPLIVLIDACDADSPEQYDWDLINDLMTRFPQHGLSKLARGYKLNKEGDVDQAFDLFSEGLEACPQSVFGYICLCWIYYQSKEYETGLEYATRGRELVKKTQVDTGIERPNALISMELCMAHCYRLLDEKYHMDASALYRSILQRRPDHTSALEGMGLILMHERRLDEALDHFSRVHQLDPANHTSVAELGWVYFEKREMDQAIDHINKALEIADSNTDRYHYLYRLGRVYWFMEDTAQAFSYFMQAVKLNPYFANGFTYLGHYYRQVKKDGGRAKKCYQKAYLLDPLDADAAHCLSDYLIAENNLEEAETIFRQVTESCPKVGWAWRRMGYVNMKTHAYNEAIICFQKALRTDTSDVRCWEGLAESYSRAGRFVAALRAFDRATQLDPHSIHAHHEKAYVQQKVGLLDDAIAGFKHTLDLAAEQNKPHYVPALAGLAETYLEHAKEDLQAGFFGRASDGCNRVFETALLGLQQDASLSMLWKLVGDACAFYRHIPRYLDNCAYHHLQDIMQLAFKAHETLSLEPDLTSHWMTEFLALTIEPNQFSLPIPTALDVVLSCASYAYKQVIVLSRNHPGIASAFWHDLANVYYHLSHQPHEAKVAIQCAKVALKMEPTQWIYWNTLGVIAMTVAHLPKMAHHAFIRAMEFNNRSAIPWTNYGFLCLTLKDYELANQAFEMAHSLDPEWISAWVGQAHVASLWGQDAGAIFEHAFESSNGSALDGSYGYADTVYQALLHGASVSVVMPIFALEKLTEKRTQDALAFNLKGLLLERIGQYGRAAEAFASAILAVEAQLEANKIEQEEAVTRLSKIHANLGRVLCAHGDFEGAIATVHDASGVYAQLNAGIAYYFMDRLPESLEMFESALNVTQQDIALRQDVIVLLSKVLWALGGDEQRSVAKDQLFSSISENPNYLPAIFSLCVMGMLEEDETLTAAALQELAKISIHVAYDTDKEQLISWLFTKYYQLKGDQAGSVHALVKSVHQTPWLSLVWNRLCTHLVKIGNGQKMISASALIMSAKSNTADAKSEAFEYAALTEDQDKAVSRKYAQRAILMAPWRLSAWKAL